MPGSTSATSDESPERGWKWWASHVLTPLLVALIGAAALIYATSDRSGGGEPRGAITFPGDGTRVPRAFTAEGTLDDIPSDRHVWLAVQAGGLFFPKEPELAVESNWLAQSIEAGEPPGGKFSLVLLMVGETGQRQIDAWLEHGVSSGEFAGLRAIGESTTLDSATQLSLPRTTGP